MTYTVGQEIADGKIVIVTVDETRGKITVLFPTIIPPGQYGDPQPLSTGYDATVTIEFLKGVLAGLEMFIP